jgi:hypothetical protein
MLRPMYYDVLISELQNCIFLYESASCFTEATKVKLYFYILIIFLFKKCFL